MFILIKKTGAVSGVEGDTVSGLRGIATLSSFLCGMLSKEKRFSASNVELKGLFSASCVSSESGS